MAIRMGEMKLIVGNPGQNNVATYPTPDASGKTYAFGASGGIHEEGTGHCRAPSGHTHGFNGKGEWLFNLSADLSEVTNLAALPQYAGGTASVCRRHGEFAEHAPRVGLSMPAARPQYAAGTATSQNMRLEWASV